MPDGFEIVALASSAGGLKALSEVLAGLPADFPAALVVVQHLDPRHRSLMAEILGRRTSSRSGRLPTTTARGPASCSSRRPTATCW